MADVKSFEKPDLTKLEVKVVWKPDMWQEIKNAAMFTIHKDNGKYPNSNWKRKILMAEHSPIRCGHIIINIYNCPQFVVGHLVRHTNGIEKFVSSLRSDRISYEDGKVPDRNTLQDVKFDINYQAFINISRKRLCRCASYETRYVWQKVKEAVQETEPELAACMVRECVYRNGLCPEMYSCGYNHTQAFEKELSEYTKNYYDQLYHSYDNTTMKPVLESAT